MSEFDERIDNMSPVLYGDLSRISQTISNLLSNGCKWARSVVCCRTQLLFPLASVSLDGPVPAVLVRFEVEDDGHGIMKSDLQDQRLFSPYVKTETQRGGKGAGLGTLECSST